MIGRSYMVLPGLLLCITQATASDRIIYAPDGAPGDHFGISLSASHGMVLIGSVDDQQNEGNSGSAYLSEIATGKLLRKFVPPTVEGSMQVGFGRSVSLSGTTSLIGSIELESDLPAHGAVHVYDTATGAYRGKLGQPNSSSSFGISLSAAGGHILIGDPQDGALPSGAGAAHLYDAESRQLLRSFFAPNGKAYDNFGGAVALSGDIGVIGSPGDDTDARDRGAAYVFDVTTGTLIHKLLPPIASPPLLSFGSTVSIAGDLILVGAPGDQFSQYAGSAYLYDGKSGALLRRFETPVAMGGDNFGRSIALSTDYSVIYSTDTDAIFEPDSVYIFNNTSGDLLRVFQPPDALSGHYIDRSIQIYGSTVLVGVPTDAQMGVEAGSVHLLIVPEPCSAGLCVGFLFLTVLSFSGLRSE